MNRDAAVCARWHRRAGACNHRRFRRLLAPPRTPPPAYDQARPEPAEDGYVRQTESTLIDAPLETFRDWVNHTELQDLIPKSPQVVRTELIKGGEDPDQDRAGTRRRIVLDDGHFTAEEILVDEPDLFRYIVFGYTNYAGLMIDHAVGEFHYDDDSGKTRLTWT